MLKIKDNVDFYTIRNMGFGYDDFDGRFKYRERNLDGSTYIYINKWNRRIVYRQDKCTDTICLSKLFDLIQAGFVENVKEVSKQ